jgi:2-hydroxy-3-keto-5-methylthiopentenyl-1-phosphate phosphatase
MVNILLLDFDDTIFPSSYFLEVVSNSNIVKFTNDLSSLDSSLYDLIQLCNEKQIKVYIVSNTDRDKWIESIIEKILPKTNIILNTISIVYSRLLFEHEYPMEIVRWKVETFLNILNELKGVEKIISIGDAISDRLSTMELKQHGFDPKFIKFMEAPSPLQLIAEIKLVLENFTNLWNNDIEKDLKINIVQTNLNSTH